MVTLPVFLAMCAANILGQAVVFGAVFFLRTLWCRRRQAWREAQEHT